MRAIANKIGAALLSGALILLVTFFVVAMIGGYITLWVWVMMAAVDAGWSPLAVILVPFIVHWLMLLIPWEKRKKPRTSEDAKRLREKEKKRKEEDDDDDMFLASYYGSIYYIALDDD